MWCEVVVFGGGGRRVANGVEAVFAGRPAWMCVCVSSACVVCESLVRVELGELVGEVVRGVRMAGSEAEGVAWWCRGLQFRLRMHLAFNHAFVGSVPTIARFNSPPTSAPDDSVVPGTWW